MINENFKYYRNEHKNKSLSKYIPTTEEFNEKSNFKDN